MEKPLNHRPRKRFGQNFLQDPMIIGQIISSLHLISTDNVLEIGPGMAALTKPLLQALDHLTAVEIDRDLHAALHALSADPEHFTLIEADALTLDYRQFGNRLRVIGNLPYNISTPLLFHLLSFADAISDMHFMLQKEVVLRLASAPNSKNYGRLSVMMQYRCEVDHLFDVPPHAFYPAPKVDSAIVRLRPYHEPIYPAVNPDIFGRLLVQSFSMRRKTLANNLKPILSAEALREIGIDPGLRPEQLSVLDYVTISNAITHRKSK